MAKLFKLISEASIAPGFSAAQVQQGLQRFKLASTQCQRLLQQRVVIKQGLNYADALKYQDAFAKVGLQTCLEAYHVEVANPEAALSKRREQLLGALMARFAKPVEHSELSRAYRRSFALAAASALLAPLLYVAIIVGVLALAAWFFTGGHTLLFGATRHELSLPTSVWLLSYLLPAAVFLLTSLFLLYPMLPRGGTYQPVILDRQKYADFYALIEQMAKAMQVPAPTYIALDHRVNAAAGSADGLGSLLRGELKLVLGLSLVAGMNVQQLLGVVAHEFGHFAQRSSMLAYWFINTVNQWLYDCAHGQDDWQDAIERWQEKLEDVWLLALPLLAAQLAISGVRWLFAHLYRLNVWATQGLSQQMEFDADSYEAKVAGSVMFRESTLRLRSLGYAAYVVDNVNWHALHEQDRLLRNIPAAVVQLQAGFPASVQQRLQAGMEEEETRYWDSHPADLERILHAEGLKAPGLLRCTEPASTLLGDFESLSVSVTRAHYRDLGIHGASEFISDNQPIMAPVLADFSGATTQAA